MSASLSTGEFLCIVDKDGNPIGKDQASGGYPHVASIPEQIYYWGFGQLMECTRYLKVINYNRKGKDRYRMVRANISINDDLPSPYAEYMDILGDTNA